MEALASVGDGRDDVGLEGQEDIAHEAQSSAVKDDEITAFSMSPEPPLTSEDMQEPGKPITCYNDAWTLTYVCI